MVFEELMEQMLLEPSITPDTYEPLRVVELLLLEYESFNDPRSPMKPWE